MKMLRKKDTGELFRYTDILASRDDMEIVETNDLKEKEVLEEYVSKSKKKMSSNEHNK